MTISVTEVLRALGENLRCNIGMHNVRRMGSELSFDYAYDKSLAISVYGSGEYRLVFSDIEDSLYASIDRLREVFEVHTGLKTIL